MKSCLVYPSIRTTYIILVAIAALAIVTMFHPMLRTVGVQTINYEIISENNLVTEAAEKAFGMWEVANPGLVFSQGGGVSVVLAPLPDGLDGLALCPFWVDSEDWCVIMVSSSIADRYDYPTNKNKMANVLAHEMGHILGIMHATDNGHLMHGYVLGWQFDNRGLTVPEQLSPDD